MEAGTGIRRIDNEQIAEAAAVNSDITLAFAGRQPPLGLRVAETAHGAVEGAKLSCRWFPPIKRSLRPSKSAAASSSARLAPGGATRALHRHYHVPASNTAVGHLVLEPTE